jgi:hypothetical protein
MSNLETAATRLLTHLRCAFPNSGAYYVVALLGLPRDCDYRDSRPLTSLGLINRIECVFLLGPLTRPH